MTITEVYTAFVNGLVDKYGDAQITDFEFTELFNTSALQELIEDYKPTDNNTPLQTKGFEASQQMLDKWFTLIKPISVSNPATGQLLHTTIETAVGGSVFHIDNIFRDGYYARWVRHNDRGIALQNQFKKPTVAHPIWSGYSDYLLIQPVSGDITMTVTKYPRKVVFDDTDPNNNVNPDLTDIAINRILDRMSQRYGVTIREQQLYEDSLQVRSEQ